MIIREKCRVAYLLNDGLRWFHLIRHCDRCPLVSTNEHLASFPLRALARAMISALFGGNELLLSVSRRVGNATERCDAWQNFKFDRYKPRKFWSRSIAGQTRAEIRCYLPFFRGIDFEYVEEVSCAQAWG